MSNDEWVIQHLWEEKSGYSGVDLLNMEMYVKLLRSSTSPFSGGFPAKPKDALAAWEKNYVFDWRCTERLSNLVWHPFPYSLLVITAPAVST